MKKKHNFVENIPYNWMPMRVIALSFFSYLLKSRERVRLAGYLAALETDHNCNKTYDKTYDKT